MAESSRSGSEQGARPLFDYEKAVPGEELGSYEYTLTEEQFNRFREAVEYPSAPFPTIAVKHDGTSLREKYTPTHSVNARQVMEFFNAPVPGKQIRVKGKIVDKYVRRDKPYLVIQAEAVDEDGRLIERTTTYQLKKTDEVGKKWGQQ